MLRNVVVSTCRMTGYQKFNCTIVFDRQIVLYWKWHDKTNILDWKWHANIDSLYWNDVLLIQAISLRVICSTGTTGGSVYWEGDWPRFACVSRNKSQDRRACNQQNVSWPPSGRWEGPTDGAIAYIFLQHASACKNLLLLIWAMMTEKYGGFQVQQPHLHVLGATRSEK